MNSTRTMGVITQRPAPDASLPTAIALLNGPRRRCCAGIILSSIVLVTVQPANAWVVDQLSTVNIGGQRTYADAFEIIDLPILDVSPPAISFNAGLVSGGASGHAGLDARFVINSANSSFDLASKASGRTFMFTATPQPTVGESFYLINQVNSLGIQKLNIQSNGFEAYAGLFADLKASAWGQACLGFCAEASIKLKVAGPLPLAQVNAGGLSLFGSLIDTSLPYSFSGLGGMASATASIPTFSKTFTNLTPGQSAVMAPKQESVVTAKLDVAGLVAKAAGFPLPLKGDLLGFGYELFSLDAFAGLNLEHAFSFKPLDLKTLYQFSSPVEFFDTKTNKWSSPITLLTMSDNEAMQLRSAGATSIGMTSFQQLNYKLDYDFDLWLNAGVDLSAIELHGLGLSLGPLIDPEQWKISLGKFDIDSGSSTGNMLGKGGTTTISFKSQTISNPGPGYVTETTPLGIDGLVQQKKTYRVLNLGSERCDGINNSDCIVDLTFAPFITQVRSSAEDTSDRTAELLTLLNQLGFRSVFDGMANSALEYALDFDELGRFLAASPLVEGAASSPEMMLAALRELGIDPDHPFPARQPLTGAPPLTEPLTENRFASLELVSVPEPPPLALLVIAGLALASTRRRRPEAWPSR